MLKRNDYFLAGILTIALIALLDLLTNSIDVQGIQWDFRYYIDMARDGLSGPLTSPFAYRYATPLLVRALTGLGLSIENGFRLLAYLGAFTQLMGIFAFIGWLTRSRKAAYITLLVTGFSLFNVKFLLFDVFRPDHFAYAFILLATWLAFQRKFIPLLLVTLVASQFREFTVVPLIAYLCSFAWMETSRRTFFAQAGLSALGLTLALGLPRLLLPVTQDFQFVSFSINGILNMVLAPFIPLRDLNFVYTVFGYLMPLLVIASLPQIRTAYKSLKLEVMRFLTVYTVLVLLLSFFGGTDFPRFATFLFIPQIILIGKLADRTRNWLLALMLVSTVIFNLLWMHVPLDSIPAYRDFYGGYQTQVTLTTMWRIVEVASFITLGWLVRTYMPLRPTEN